MLHDSSPAVRPFPAWLLALLAITLAGNVIAWLTLGLLPDEAYYWVWSQRLQAGYFDHPPLVAWLIRPFTELFGQAAPVVRVPAVLSWLVGAVLSYDLARRIYRSPRAGAYAVLVWSSLPLVQAGFHVVTPDAPMVIFAWAAYYCAWRAVAEERPVFWLGAGLSAGLALLGKYPAVLVLGGVFIALLLSQQGRRQLRTPWPWLGALLAILAFMPVVYWNWQHDWISFAFQFGHGVKKTIATDPLQMALRFVGGQLLVVMPWTLLAMIWAASPLDRTTGGQGFGRILLVSGFWLPLLIFGLAGLTSSSEANWPESAYIPGTLLLAGLLHHWLDRAGVRAGRIARTVVFVAVLFSVVFVDMVRFPHWMQWLPADTLPVQRTQLSHSYGWDQAGAELRRILPQVERSHPAGSQCGIIVDYHASAGMVAWLLNAPLRVGVTADSRFNQYHLWADEAARQPGDLCLFIKKYDQRKTREERIPSELDLPEGHWQELSRVEATGPDLSRRWFVFYVPAAAK